MVKSVQMLDNFTRRLSIQLIPIYNKMEEKPKEKQIFFYVRIKNNKKLYLPDNIWNHNRDAALEGVLEIGEKIIKVSLNRFKYFDTTYDLEKNDAENLFNVNVDIDVKRGEEDEKTIEGEDFRKSIEFIGDILKEKIVLEKMLEESIRDKYTDGCVLDFEIHL